MDFFNFYNNSTEKKQKIIFWVIFTILVFFLLIIKNRFVTEVAKKHEEVLKFQKQISEMKIEKDMKVSPKSEIEQKIIKNNKKIK